MTQEEQCAVLPTAWNLSLLYMYPRVFMWRGQKIMGLCVYGAGQPGIRGFLKNPRHEQLNL